MSLELYDSSVVTKILLMNLVLYASIDKIGLIWTLTAYWVADFQ